MANFAYTLLGFVFGSLIGFLFYNWGYVDALLKCKEIING